MHEYADAVQHMRPSLCSWQLVDDSLGGRHSMHNGYKQQGYRQHPRFTCTCMRSCPTLLLVATVVMHNERSLCRVPTCNTASPCILIRPTNLFYPPPSTITSRTMIFSVRSGPILATRGPKIILCLALCFIELNSLCASVRYAAPLHWTTVSTAKLHCSLIF